jgi:ribonuclease VapC
MVIDTSALIAILFREAEADGFITAIAASSTRLVGTPTALETVMVAVGRLSPIGRDVVDRLWERISAEIVPFTQTHSSRAAEAFIRYGKGRHPAGLNFGDCCSYALAAETGLPLLFKGADFAHTDISSALIA